MIRFICCCIILLFASNSISAQGYHFEVQEIHLKDGLPSRHIDNITQDKSGYIWLSTLGTICRYDGEKIKVYDAAFLGISENVEVNIAVDKNNNIWYTEYVEIKEEEVRGGILNPRKNEVYEFDEYTNQFLPANGVHNITNSLVNIEEWFLTTKTGTVYKYSDGLEEIFQFPNIINEAATCNEDDNGNYWISDMKRLFKVRNQTVIQEPYKKRNFVYYLQATQPKLRFSEALDIYNSYTYENNALIRDSIKCIYSDKNKIYQLPSSNVLQIVDHEGKQLFEYRRKGERPQEHRVFSFFQPFIDRQNIFWLASNDGLLKIVQKKNPFTILQQGNSTRGISLEGVCQYIGCYNNNVFPETKDMDKKEEELFQTLSLTHFTKDEKGHYWISTMEATIVEYNPELKELKRYGFEEFSIDARSYYPFYNCVAGELWIGTSKGLFVFDRFTKEIKPIPLAVSPFNVEIRQIYENEEGIWLVSNQGLSLLTKETGQLIQHYDQTNQLPYHNLNHLYEDKEGLFWIATKGGGLLKWNRKTETMQRFRQEDGLSNNVLYAVYEDDYNNLWLPSNYGLMSFDKTSATTKVYLTQNGIVHNEFNTFSHFKATDGTLYFGGINGITKFHPRNLRDSEQEDAPLYLQDLKIFSTKTNQFENKTNDFLQYNRIELEPTDKIVEVELKLLDYASPTSQYAYRIGGEDNQWIYTNSSKITFTNLAYGKYPIHFKARGASGIWTEKLLMVPFYVKKPIYLQTWFFVIVALLFLILTISIIRWRENQLKKEKESLEQEVKNRTQEIEASKTLILQQTEELKTLDKAKTRFFSNITHEFRTPLTLIIGPLQQLTKKTKDEDVNQLLLGVIRNSKIILQLINQLLDISKLESGEMKIEYYKGDIIDYTKQIIQNFQVLAAKKSIELGFLSPLKVWEISFDKKKWDKILYNLLSNAIKFTPEGGTVELRLTKEQKQESDWIRLQVKDTGIGIAKEEIPYIFQRFHQVDSSSTRHEEGTGIGLSLVKELVDLQEGKVQVASKPNEGTTFIVQLPVLNNTIEQIDTVKHDDVSFSPTVLLDDLSSNPIAPAATIQDKEKLSLLIIEDNKEMQAYIFSCIDVNKYEVILANNGLKGIEKAQELVPDLIVSDIMMPQKGGFEVVQTIRQHIATSHIPIILLTAKAALESKLKGLSKGADAYLTKPFSPEELRLRIQKLIELRQLLQESYKNGQSKFSDTNLYLREEDNFIQRVQAFVLENIEDSRLNGELIAKHFKMSRMQLYRKIKALTNQTILEFIQEIQFNIALHLLKQKKFTISEIAYRVGFSAPSNFSRAFKQKYGKSPSNFLAEKENK